jgi:hypothetical protein
MAQGQFAYPDDVPADELSVLKSKEQFFFALYPSQSLRWLRVHDSGGRTLYRLAPYSSPDVCHFQTTLEELRDEPEWRIKQRIEGAR